MKSFFRLSRYLYSFTMLLIYMLNLINIALLYHIAFIGEIDLTVAMAIVLFSPIFSSSFWSSTIFTYLQTMNVYKSIK